jgi:hypothetical protein
VFHCSKFFYPLKSILTNFHQFWPIFINFDQFSSILTNFHQFWPIFINFDQLFGNCDPTVWQLWPIFRQFWTSFQQF